MQQRWILLLPYDTNKVLASRHEHRFKFALVMKSTAAKHPLNTFGNNVECAHSSAQTHTRHARNGRRVVSKAIALLFGCGMLSPAEASDTLRLDLQSCIARAKRDGANARALRFEYASQCAEHDAARAEFLPQLSLDASLPGYSRAIAPVLQPDGTNLYVSQTQTFSDASLQLNQKIPFTGGDLSISSSLDNRVNLQGERREGWSATPFSIQLRQPLTGYNPYTFQRRLDDMRFEAQTRSYIEQMEELSAQAAGRFFDYYISGMNIGNAELNIALNDSIHVLAKGRYNFGKIAENDLLQNELAVLSARNDFERARLSRDRSLAALQLLLGLPSGTVIVAQTPPMAKEISIDIPKTLAYALAHRSDAISYDMQALDAERSLDQAKVNNRFNIQLIASYGLNQSATSMQGSYQNLLEQQRLTLNVGLPLITWGRTSSLVEAARAQSDKVEAMNSLRRAELQQEIEYDLRDFQQLSSLLGIADRSQSIAERRYEVARNRYIIGKIETTELMLAQKEKDESKRSYYSSLRDYWVSYYRIRKTTLYDIENNRPISVQSEDEH